MRALRTEIEINASAEKVWQMLIDFDGYAQWNPFVRSVEGKAVPNSRLNILIQPTGAHGMKFRPTMLKAEPEKELRRLGSLFVRGLFDGEHIFTIEPISETSVRFVQREKFSGLLAPLFWRSLDKDTRLQRNEHCVKETRRKTVGSVKILSFLSSLIFITFALL